MFFLLKFLAFQIKIYRTLFLMHISTEKDRKPFYPVV